jgi:hypothetical protein
MMMTIYRHKYPGHKKILRIILFSNLRPYLRPPVPDHAGGCYVSLMRFPVPFSPESRIPGIAEFLDRQLKRASVKGDKFFFAWMSKMAMKKTIHHQNVRMGDVAFSYSGPIPVTEKPGDGMLNGIHGFISNNRLATTLSGFGKIIFGRLSLDLNYLTEETSRETALKLSEDIKAQLLQLIIDL